MKKILFLLFAVATLMPRLSAQICTPDSSNFTAGIFVYPASLPCITQGSSFGANVNIRIPDSVDAHLFDTALAVGTYLYVDSVRFDSIIGAPTGISVANNPVDSIWMYAGTYGCVQFLGSTSVAAGNYPLAFYGSGCVHGMINGNAVNTCYNGMLPSYFGYTLSVCAPIITTVCTPDSSNFTSGVNVYPATLPCIAQGVAFSGTVNIKIPSQIDAHLFVSALPANTYFLTVDSIFLDSINGTPVGITAVSNPGDSVWLHGGQFACAQFSGITSAPVGNYPLDIHGRGCVHGNILGFAIDSCVSGSLSSYINYSLNVCNGSGACAVDSAHFGNGTQVYPSSLPCIVTGEPFAGQVNIQVPASLDLTDFIPQVPANTATVFIDSIDITSITGYPAGISSISNPVLGTWLYPGNGACAAISGTVNGNITPAGNYPLTISGTGCGHFTLGGQTIRQCMTNYSFTKVFPFSLSVCYPAGVSDVTEGVALTIYPNPNQGNFTVTVSSSERVNGTMSILDQLGRVIKTQNIDVTGTRQIALDLGEISAGAYILMINTAQSKSVKQFIVK
jgi:hypothetical protein